MAGVVRDSMSSLRISTSDSPIAISPNGSSPSEMG
jgi:hypothetical protein